MFRDEVSKRYRLSRVPNSFTLVQAGRVTPVTFQVMFRCIIFVGKSNQRYPAQARAEWRFLQ